MYLFTISGPNFTIINTINGSGETTINVSLILILNIKIRARTPIKNISVSPISVGPAAILTAFTSFVIRAIKLPVLDELKNVKLRDSKCLNISSLRSRSILLAAPIINILHKNLIKTMPIARPIIIIVYLLITDIEKLSSDRRSIIL